MKIHRFFSRILPEEQVVVIDDGAIAHQISKVLKLERSELIALTDGNGHEITLMLTVLSPSITATVLERKTIPLPRRTVTLCTSLLKKENFELVVQKAAEIGVGKIVPLITERTVKLGFKRPRFEQIIKEAMEQSGQSYLPSITDPVNFKDALTQNYERKILCNQGGDAFAVHDVSEIAIFIGPEGGWSDTELAFAKSSGAEIISLGPTTLRAETAAIVATYLIQNS